MNIHVVFVSECWASGCLLYVREYPPVFISQLFVLCSRQLISRTIKRKERERESVRQKNWETKKQFQPNETKYQHNIDDETAYQITIDIKRNASTEKQTPKEKEKSLNIESVWTRNWNL